MENLSTREKPDSDYVSREVERIMFIASYRSLSEESIKLGRVILYRLCYDHRSIRDSLDLFEIRYKKELTSDVGLDFSHDVTLSAIENRHLTCWERANAYLSLLRETLVG